MLKNLLVILLLIAGLSGRVNATHIVGGELEMRHLSGSSYRVSLILYFDRINGSSGARDPSVTVGMFSKSTNAFMDSVLLPLVSTTRVPYRNPACNGQKLDTDKLVYSTVVVLDPWRYSEAQGYYMQWERCCRNYIISNIVNPESTGQTFYMEFPALLQNNQPFINSSPRSFPALNSYVCVGEAFSFPFGGADPDGDQLFYSLVTPLQGNSTPTLPVISPRSAPYPSVTWAPGLGVNNMIPGIPSLRVNDQGVISVTPLQVGLFVFGIKCEEFRDGVKIGEVRRDYQMLVVDCRQSYPPVANLTDPKTKKFYREGDTIRIKANEGLCSSLAITSLNFNTNIEAQLVPVNFTADSKSILPVTTGTVKGPGDTLRLQVCFPACPLPDGKPHRMNFIVKDASACPVPLYDTVRVMVEVQVERNEKPGMEIPLTYDPLNKYYVREVLLGEEVNLEILAKDLEKDLVTLSAYGINFTLGMENMLFPSVQATPPFKSNFKWITNCSMLKPGEKSREFLVNFVATDLKGCSNLNSPNSDTVKVKFVLNLKGTNRPPVTSTSLPGYDAATRTYTAKVIAGETLRFDFMVNDADKDPVSLLASGQGFRIWEDAKMTYTPFNRQVPVARGYFEWKPDCSMLKNGRDEKDYVVYFIGNDHKSCNLTDYDTVRVKITVSPGEKNTPPKIATSLQYDPKQGYSATLIAGEELVFELKGTDPDFDIIALGCTGEGFELSAYDMEFTPVRGVAPQQTTFRWKTHCGLLALNKEEFLLRFLVNDERRCNLNGYDTLTVRLKVVDRPGIKPFEPYNVFTPNGDEYNKTFKLLEVLPPDNCADQFMDISIYNRWGNLVFKSDQRDFEWTGDTYPSGVYFYFLRYKNSTYKGTVTLLRGRRLN